jgi:hypothetical protein
MAKKHITGGNPLPQPLINALKRSFPGLVHGVIKGNDVFLIAPMPLSGGNQEALVATHYIASPEFLTAVRIAESDEYNLKILCEAGFEMMLRAPRGEEKLK